MIASIIRWSIANRLIVIFMALFLTAGGIWSLRSNTTTQFVY